MVAVSTATGLIASLRDLAHTLESLDLKVASVAEPEAPSLRAHLTRTIRSYLIPRLENQKTPLCVVFAGPTGSGKSTLVNSLSGVELSKTGPLRPTTKGPIVLASSQSNADYSVLAGVECDVVEGNSVDLEWMSMVDTPDIDSTVVEHREMTRRLIDTADVVVLVTSALRYADEVPWDVLRRAQRRGTAMLHVLNRVTPASAGALADLKARLVDAGVEGEVFRVPEYHLAPGDQSLPAASVKRLAVRLREMARDRDAHLERITRVASAVVAESGYLAGLLERAKAWLGKLEDELVREFSDAVERLDLTGLGAFAFIDDPPTSARRRKRWLKRHKIDEPETARRLGEVERRLTAAIEDDLGSLSLRPGDMVVQLPGVGDPLRPESLRNGIEAALMGWFDYVARMTLTHEQEARGLATVALLECALDDCPTEFADALLGESADSLVTRARRELRNRLESLYEAAGRRTLAQIAHLTMDASAGKALRRTAERVARLLEANA